MREVGADHGGLDAPAALTGALVAISVLAILAAVLGAIFSGFALDIYHSGPHGDQTRFGAALGALALLAAFFWGGWATGRAARYGMAANAVAVVVFTLVIGLALTLIGHAADTNAPLLSGQLPGWLTNFSTSSDALISALVGLALMLVGAIAGALRGVRYHRQLDRELLAEPEDMIDATQTAPEQPDRSHLRPAR